MTVFTLGGILQMVGVIVVAVGALRTWREFAPDESVTKPALDAARAFLGSLRARLRPVVDRLLRRPPQHIVGTGAIVVHAAAINGRGIVGYAPLPADTDVAEALRQLDHRTRDISNRLAGTDERLIDEADAIRQEMAGLREMLDAHVVRLDAKGRKAATGGVRTSLVGGSLVILGVALQTFA